MIHMLGRYEVLAELGHGAMGTVYRARDPMIDRIVAIKTIHALGDAEKDAEYCQRFFREAQAAGKLSHPGIVTIHDVGEDERTQTPYIVMEYVDGRTLQALLTGPETERLSLEASLELIRQIAEGLEYAHSQGIVHRDIKPANIMVTHDGRAKITDFGIAKLAVSHLTVPGQMLGTPSYASPEQLSGGTVDGRSDLFSLGVILYSVLTGDKPFAGNTFTAVSFKIVYQQPIPVSQLNPSLQPEFDYVLERALAKNPSNRYQSGKEFADDLDDLRRGRPPRSQGARNEPAAPEKTVLIHSLNPAVNLLGSPPNLAEALPLELDDRSSIRKETAPSSELFSRRGGYLPNFVQHGLSYARGLPPKAQATLIVAAVVVLTVFSFRTVFPAKTARLNLECHHGFRSAELTVWIDNWNVYEGKLTGAEQGGFKLFGPKTIEGSLSETVKVAPGRHVVRVRVTSSPVGYAQTKEIEGEFVKDAERTLVINCGARGGELSLAWR